MPILYIQPNSLNNVNAKRTKSDSQILQMFVKVHSALISKRTHLYCIHEECDAEW